MNSGEGLDFKANMKKLYPNPSARVLNKKQTLPHDIINGFSKQTRARITDHTDDRNSERSQSHHTHPDNYHRAVDDGGQLYSGESRVTNHKDYASENGMRFLSEKQEKIIELRERLKNIHHFYRIRIEQQRTKNIERNEIFIGIIQELQRNHSDRLLACRKSLQELQQQKNELGYVDERMGNIKNTIEQILMQSKQLKISNENIEKQLLRKEVNVKQKQAQYMEMKEQINALRDKLQQFERLKLKENKRNKDLLEMIDQAHR